MADPETPRSVTSSRVRIAVLTFQRPGDIAAALPRLLEQARGVTDALTTADIVVVDNDPAGSARSAVTELASSTPDVVIRYEHEPTPGIAAARNRALDTAVDVDLLVFIDDDERPSPAWLSLLLRTYAEHRSAAVVGPVVSEFAEPPSSWITAGRFFDRLRRPTGTPVGVAATNNLLLDLHQIRPMGLRFDVAFGLSGGSDTLFTRELHRRGGRLIWCDEAVVSDVVPSSRATRGWVLRRALRSGNSWSRTSLELSDSAARRTAVRLRLGGQGLLRLAGGGARLVVGVLARSQGQRARGLRTLARSAGMLSGACGYVYQEYRRRPQA
ncbi:MAG TPA: glycosyltransferase [Propionibacteriaceae bacterium]